MQPLVQQEQAIQPVLPKKIDIDTSWISVDKKMAGFLEQLTCKICLQVLWDPTQCGGCESHYCQADIQAMKDRVCPLCRQEKWVKPNRVVLNVLNSLMLTCQKCKKPEIIYQDYPKHVAESCGKKKAEKIQQGQSKPISEIAKKNVNAYYQFKYRDGAKMEPYAEEDNRSINMNLRMNEKSFCVVHGLYQINLDAKKQKNVKSGFQRTISMEQDKEHVEKYCWFVRTDVNKYLAFAPKLSDMIEADYQSLFVAAKKTKSSLFKLGDKEYYIDFEGMRQHNTISNYSRKVYRMLI